jgi:hypothetical protein
VAIRIVLFMHHPLATLQARRWVRVGVFRPAGRELCHRPRSMRAPAGLPRAIRTDRGNSFANHTMRVRVPEILESVIAHGLENQPEHARAVARLAADLRENAALPPPDPALPDAATWQRALADRGEPRWLDCDWFFAENYAYRMLCEKLAYWQSHRDPFLAIKRAEYASQGHLLALDTAARIAGPAREQLVALLGAAVFGNRMDLSFAASRERGVLSARGDLLIDERESAADLLLGGVGPVHFLIDNAGTELSVDLVLVSRLLELLDSSVVLHLKFHPCFVSDAILDDVRWFVLEEDDAALRLWRSAGKEARRCRTVLARALASGRLQLAPHAFWNSPGWLWDVPAGLERELGAARLVILKGDAHYRRAVGDALWPADTPTRAVTAYFPAPLLALRTLKSDPIVGLCAFETAELDAADPTWRVNGQRAVAALGGACPAPAAT